jgi:hypothetical protein
MHVRSVLGGEKLVQRFKPLDDKPKDSSRLLHAVFAARARLLRWNEAPPPPLRVPDCLRREISETLAPDIALLATVIDRDLDHWLGGRTRTARPIWANAQAAPPVEVTEHRSRRRAAAG